MPYIHLRYNKGKPNEYRVWTRITDHDIDKKTGDLVLFRLTYDDGTVKDCHLYRNEFHLADVAASIFLGQSSLRSAKGLMQDYNKLAGKEQWHGKAGMVGMAIGSAVLLHMYLKSKPFRQEGYYDSSGNMVLPGTINTRNTDIYDPRMSPPGS